MNEATLRLEQVKMKEQYLIDQINERYMLQLSEIAANYAEVEIDVHAMESEVNELKSKLNKDWRSESVVDRRVRGFKETPRLP